MFDLLKRLRQRRYSSMTPPMGQRSRSSQLARSRQQYPHSVRRSQDAGDYWEGGSGDALMGGWGNSHSVQNLSYHAASRAGSARGGGGGFPLFGAAIANEAFWHVEGPDEDWTRNNEGADEGTD